ncbi:SHOCT domain-containing protein [Streptomyces sp. NPDC046866]|uniref:SHOCT domain-containing protein n=1 Tax=Streptomyces sp. NPDC046866 TaxID=3154921 RepID=UPI00345501A5
MSGWGWFAMSLTTLLLVALIAALAVCVLRPSPRAGARGEPPSAVPPAPPAPGAARGAETVLADRHARGEIDEEEYARRLAVLRSHAPRTTSP